MAWKMEDKQFKHYEWNVLWGWDWNSHATKWGVDEANIRTSDFVRWLLTWKDWEIRLWNYILSMWTDWVWTKIQIYMRQFENYFQEYNKSEKSEENYNIALTSTIELCDRMLADLTAMLFDDWIKWERSIAFTDIIDTNNTDNTHGTRPEIFFKAFKISLWKSIIGKDSLNLNWETANLWENWKFVRALERYRKSWELAKKEVTRLTNEINNQRNQLALLYPSSSPEVRLATSKIEKGMQSNKDWRRNIIEEFKSARKDMIDLWNELELNLAWTFLWVKKAEKVTNKLVKMEEWDKIIVLSETETKNWIISPRSNGLTLIRQKCKELLWDNWENKTFEDYLLTIGSKASKLPKKLKQKLAWLKMWDIATWETTVFNKFIADDLLGWIKWKPIAKISGLRHWTWNPQYKLHSGLEWREDLMIDIDISELEKADIFTLLQVAFDLDDKTVAKPWNMWIPYTIFCKPWEEDKILEQARESWITANLVWEIKKRWEDDPSVRIKWVWIWKSEITYSKDREKTV